MDDAALLAELRPTAAHLLERHLGEVDGLQVRARPGTTAPPDETALGEPQ